MKLAYLAFAFLVGCSSTDTNDGDGGTKKGGKSVGVVTGNNPSCSVLANGVCTDYIGMTAQGTVKQVCTFDGGYSTAACPSSNRIGSCTVGADGNPNQVIRRYYSPAFTVMVAQKDCAGSMGTFTEN